MTTSPTWLDDLRHIDVHEAMWDLVRFVDDPADAALATVVNNGARGERGDVHHVMTDDDREILFLVMRRGLVKSLRENSPAPLQAVFDALTLVPDVTGVPWSTWLEGAAWQARQLSYDLTGAMEQMNESAAPAVAARFAITCEASTRMSSLEDCHLKMVETSYGLGVLVAAIDARTSDAQVNILARNPHISEPTIRVDAVSTLARIAVDIADAFELDDDVITGPIVFDQIAETLFDLVVEGTYVPTNGTLSFSLERLDLDLWCAAYVAELADGENAMEWVEATSAEDMVVVASEPYLCVLLAPPSFDEGAEPVAWESFARVAQEILDRHCAQ